MNMSVADKMSQAYVQGADDQKRRLAKEINAQENIIKQQRQELAELRELADEQARIISRDAGQRVTVLHDQARIISSMTKQIRKLHEAKES